MNSHICPVSTSLTTPVSALWATLVLYKPQRQLLAGHVLSPSSRFISRIMSTELVPTDLHLTWPVHGELALLSCRLDLHT